MRVACVKVFGAHFNGTILKIIPTLSADSSLGWAQSSSSKILGLLANTERQGSVQPQHPFGAKEPIFHQQQVALPEAPEFYHLLASLSHQPGQDIRSKFANLCLELAR